MQYVSLKGMARKVLPCLEGAGGGRGGGKKLSTCNFPIL